MRFSFLPALFRCSAAGCPRVGHEIYFVISSVLAGVSVAKKSNF